MNSPSTCPSPPDPPPIPDHQLLRCIGRGSYGEVWLARNLMGSYRAVKTVHRTTFDSDRPFEREFNGIQKFEPISRSHPAFVTILHVGRSADGACFYYVMELADDAVCGQAIPPDKYQPRTLRTDLERHGKMPVQSCIDLALELGAGLAHLHGQGLIHRDIKPSNIIFVKGRPKFADIGLVTEMGEAATFVGTQGYLPPEGPGAASADLYSLGMVLYELCMGKERRHFPELATALESLADPLPLLGFNQIILKACSPFLANRYQCAEDFLAHLNDLRNGRLALAGAETETGTPSEAASALLLEPVGGAVPLASRFYLERRADDEFRQAITRQDSIVLVQGARQMGKTSLLARGLQQARASGARVVLVDFQSLNAEHFQSAESLYLALMESLATDLGLPGTPADQWNPRSGPNINFQRFMRRQVLDASSRHVVWGMDEVDRLFTCPFGSEIFGLFRSWHNARSLDPAGPWSRLTLAIAYATEAHLFITDINQSPFNVGTRLSLEDFTRDQVAELNRRHGSPLASDAELDRFVSVVGGHPYLVRRALYEMTARHLSLAELEGKPDHDDGPFADHLRRILVLLANDQPLAGALRGVIEGRPCPTAEGFYRLRSAGLVSGHSATEARPRCQLYAAYLQRHLP